VSTAAVETVVDAADWATVGAEAEVVCVPPDTLDDNIDRAEIDPYQPTGSSREVPLRYVRSSRYSGLASVRRFEMKRLGLDPLLGECLLPPSRLRCFLMVL
jgi:hypothetical protein